MAKKRILILGATGFIGRNVVERLAPSDDWEVVGVFHDRPPYKEPEIHQWIHADLREKTKLERAIASMGPLDAILQTAATTTGVKDTFGKPYLHVTDNVVMNALLFRAAHELRVPHLIFLSCSVMYDQTKDAPLKEEDFDPSEEMFPPYFGGAWTKVFHEKMCEFFSRLGQTRFTVVRHTNIYGPHDKFDLQKSHMFGANITKVLTCEDGKILVWGDGSERRDLLYVSDLVDFLELVLSRDADSREPFALYNVGAGSTISVRDLIALMIARSGKKIEMEFDQSKPQVRTKLCLDCSKAREKFGWSPKTPLAQGIDLTMDWWKKNVRE